MTQLLSHNEIKRGTYVNATTTPYLWTFIEKQLLIEIILHNSRWKEKQGKQMRFLVVVFT